MNCLPAFIFLLATIWTMLTEMPVESFVFQPPTTVFGRLDRYSCRTTRTTTTTTSSTKIAFLSSLSNNNHGATTKITATTTTTSSLQEATLDTYSFIQSELRTAAMRLHTKEQSPKEGRAEVMTTTTATTTTPQQQPPTTEPYRTTHTDYLAFLVDSQHVYRAMEEIVQQRMELVPFQNTGLERVVALENDIVFLMQEYHLERPVVGRPGREYAQVLYEIANRESSIPAFMCHYYNFYFAHTAGGRMIGKQMSALLLNKKTLEFYKVPCSRSLVASVFFWRILFPFWACTDVYSVFFCSTGKIVGYRFKRNKKNCERKYRDNGKSVDEG
jgi:hypothetical protein